jgi:hypothetical protein
MMSAIHVSICEPPLEAFCYSFLKFFMFISLYDIFQQSMCQKEIWNGKDIFSKIFKGLLIHPDKGYAS